MTTKGLESMTADEGKEIIRDIMREARSMENRVRGTDNLLWCSICLRDLKPDDVWLSDDTRDGRLFCYDCATDSAIRAKDAI